MGRFEFARLGQRLGAASLPFAIAACIDTGSVPSVGPASACSAAPNLPETLRAVVKVHAQLRPGSIECSGVALTPNLVVTPLGCATRPSEVSDPRDPALGNERGLSGVFPGSPDYSTACSAGGTWLPIENGSFAARLGKTVLASDLGVTRAGDERVFPVSAVDTSHGVSRCAPGVAILTLDREIDVEPISVRLDETTRVDEPVTVAGHCYDDVLGVVRRDLDDRIVAQTHETGTDVMPPRTLALTQSTSLDDVGGAVVSSNGALVGIIASGLTSGCQLDGEPSAIAWRLASFRRMLLDVAAKQPVILHVEPGATVSPMAELRPCASR